MYPLLFKIGGIPIHTYGFFIAIGFLFSLWIIRTLSIRSGLDVEKTLDLTFWSLLVGFLGARLLFILTRFSYFISEPTAIFRVWEGGLVFFGGPLAVFPFIAWYTRKFKLPLWRTVDSLVPGLVVAHMLGRVGCLAAGCCYGKPTGSDWGIRLDSELVDRAMRGIPLHPTQIYEAVALLFLLIGLIVIHGKKSFDGQVVITYFMVYPVIRSLVEIFRGDLIRGFIIDEWLSTGQFISILVFAASLFILYIRLKSLPLERAAIERGKSQSKHKKK